MLVYNRQQNDLERGRFVAPYRLELVLGWFYVIVEEKNKKENLKCQRKIKKN